MFQVNSFIPRRLFVTCFASYKSYDGLPRYHTSDLNFYTILEIEKDASSSKIKEAYFEKSKKLHPDKNPSVEAQKHYKDVREAYDILSDKKKKKAYDNDLRIQNYQEFHKRDMSSRYKAHKQQEPDNVFNSQRDDHIEKNWKRWDEFDEIDEKKRIDREIRNYKRQQEMWRRMQYQENKYQQEFYKRNFYGDEKDPGHPDGEQFKKFEEALWNENGKRRTLAAFCFLWLFFTLFLSELDRTVLALKEEQRNEMKNKSDFERLFAQENFKSKSESDRYFGNSSDIKDPKQS